MAKLTPRGRYFGLKQKPPSQSSWSPSLRSAPFSLLTEHRNSNRPLITPPPPYLSGAKWQDAMTICRLPRHQCSMGPRRIYAILRMTRVAWKHLKTWNYHCRDQGFSSRMISHRTRYVALSFQESIDTDVSLQTDQHAARKPSAESFV